MRFVETTCECVRMHFAFMCILQKMHSAHIYSTVHSVVSAFKRIQRAFFDVCIFCSLHSESDMNACLCKFQKMRPRCECVVNAFECRRLNASHGKCGLNAKECFKKCIRVTNHTHSGNKSHHTQFGHDRLFIHAVDALIHAARFDSIPCRCTRPVTP